MSSARRRPESAPAAALPIVSRLSETIAAETAAIAGGGPVPYEDFSRRKNQGLLELNRLAPALKHAPASEALRDALAELHARLEANRRSLGVQLRASIAVAEIIARAIRDGQSDGTYTALAWKRPAE
jgi:uncharacterized membrane protein YccC